MKKIFLLAGIFALLSTLSIQAQVTIGKLTPPDSSAVLQVISPDSNKGILVPKLSDTQMNAIANPANGLLIYNSSQNNFYYYDGTAWKPFGGSAAAISESPWFISGTSNRSSANLDQIYHLGQVTIGDSAAVDPTAMLNVVSTNKGVLLPRVTLKSSNDVTTIPNPTTGLLVYNTGTNPNFPIGGYMYWSGSAWMLFSSAPTVIASATLNCTGAAMAPNLQIIGGTPIPAGTILQIPYSGSNGGSYTGITLTSNGNPSVTATISSGSLAMGSGSLNFILSGTPTINQQAPNGITFDLTPFITANPQIAGCNSVNVGAQMNASVITTAVMGYLTLVTDNTGNDNGKTSYAVTCNSPDGKFSVRVYLPGGVTTVAAGNQNLNVQIRNNLSTPVTVITNYDTHNEVGWMLMTGFFTIPSQVWGGDNESGTTWFNSTTPAANNAISQGYYGNVGIYDGAKHGPEYRRYTWIPEGANNKVAYEIHVMAAIDTTDPTTAVSPTLVKCYIKFDQITAL